MSRNWTPADVTGIIANPFYAINIAPVLAEPHPLLINEDQWVASNIKLMRTSGLTPTFATCSRSSRATIQPRHPAAEQPDSTKYAPSRSQDLNSY